MKSYTFLVVIFIISILASCKKDSIDVPSGTNQPNILLIIADDLGKDAINGFTEGSIKPNTPNIDAIRNNGLSFSDFWVYPTCSPTRASIITGKYGYRTGVKWAGDELAQSELVLQQYINDQTNNSYASAIIGKWHLSENNANANPETFGIDYYAGLIRGAANDYYMWQFTEDGGTSLQTAYATEFFTDLSIDWVNQQSKPWFLWLAYNAPHVPFHAPPIDMHSQGNLPAYNEGLDPMPYYMAAIETMDYQVGRLLENIPADERANTLIIFIGDNGTPNQVAQAPYSPSTVKGSLFQGGINAPMFISGDGITRSGVDNNLVCSTDLFATIAEIAGASVSEIHDSKSFRPLFSGNATIRAFQYSEMNDGTTDAWTISNGDYKLAFDAIGNQSLYDLNNDPYEQTNLVLGGLTPEQTNAKSELESELLNIRD
jgi:arylsulfatase B